MRWKKLEMEQAVWTENTMEILKFEKKRKKKRGSWPSCHVLGFGMVLVLLLL